MRKPVSPGAPGSSGSTVSGRTGQVSLLTSRWLTKYPPDQLVCDEYELRPL
jgi:hypothetical protein